MLYKFEFYAEKVIANANNFAFAKILFFSIYEIAVILGFAR